DLPFLLGGTYALSVYTGITRATKDLDILCKPSDYPRILERFKSLGYPIEIEDERWIAKVFRGEHFFDLIFASWRGGLPVSDKWFEHAPCVEMFGIPVRVRLAVPPRLHGPALGSAPGPAAHRSDDKAPATAKRAAGK